MAASSRDLACTTDVVGLLDVGTAKTACLIVGADAQGRRMRVLGAGVRPTRGLKAGVVVEMDGVEQAIRAAVNDAERGAGLQLAEVTMSVACGRLRAQSFSADAQVLRSAVGAEDLERLAQAGHAFAQRDGRAVLDLQFVAYRLDGAPCGGDPTGLPGRSLGADMVAISADEAPLRNLMHVAERAGLATGRLIPAPLASGLAATSEEDRHLGVLCIDMGAGTTQLSMFAHGHLIASDVIPIGGNHITFDIARAFAVPVPEAERIKREYGTLLNGEADPGAADAVLPAASDANGCLLRVVESRVANLLEHIAERIVRTGLPQYAQRLVVLTGGGSRLPGLAQASERVLERPVRVGRLQGIEGLPAELAGSEFATAIGMALMPSTVGAGAAQTGAAMAEPGYLRRMGQWLRASL